MGEPDMKLYKWTTQDGKTRVGYTNETQWGLSVTHTASGEGELCSPGWLHAYTDPLLAVMLSPIHIPLGYSILWECDGKVGLSDNGLKVGCTALTTLHTIDIPVVSIEQQVAFAIMCTLEVYYEPRFVEWANNWLKGVDRTAQAAERAEVRAVSLSPIELSAARAAEWAAIAARSMEWREKVSVRWAAASSVAVAAKVSGKPLDLIRLVHKVVYGEWI